MLVEHTSGACECEAAALVGTAGIHVCSRASAVGTEDRRSRELKHLAVRAQLGVARRLLIAAELQVLVAARPTRAVDGRRILFLDVAAWTGEATALAFLRTTSPVVGVVAIWVVAHDRRSVRLLNIITRALKARAIPILRTALIRVQATASYVRTPGNLVVWRVAVSARAHVRVAEGVGDTARVQIALRATHIA